MRVRFLNENNEELYDFTTIRKKLGVTKSKLHREIKKMTDIDWVKYKNQYFYKEKTLFLLMEQQLFERLDKIEREDNGFKKN